MPAFSAGLILLPLGLLSSRHWLLRRIALLTSFALSGLFLAALTLIRLALLAWSRRSALALLRAPLFAGLLLCALLVALSLALLSLLLISLLLLPLVRLVAGLLLILLLRSRDCS